jgi:hypothetical protein
MHRHVQPRAEWLSVDDHLFIAVERFCEPWMLRLDQQRQLVVVCRIEQLQVEPR